MYAGSVGVKRLRDQQTEFPVAQDGNGGAPRDARLIQNLAGRRQRLGENRMFRGDGIGKNVQVSFRQSEELFERSRMPDNSQHLPVGTVPPKPTGAPGAAAAVEIDLTDNPLSYQSGVVRLRHLADKFVTRRTAKAVIASLQFEIRVA